MRIIVAEYLTHSCNKKTPLSEELNHNRDWRSLQEQVYTNAGGNTAVEEYYR
jgi:hypothetical protein